MRAQPPQFLVPERLDAEADAVDARGTVRGQAAVVTVSGIASIVISASGSTAKASRHAAMSAPISAGSSSDGVPPPK